jgi:restriction endonuclease Mrr
MNTNHQYQNPVELGRSFEQRVVKAFNKLGYALVDKNKWNKNSHYYRDPATKREFDLVMYNNQNRYYIFECKGHSNLENEVGVGEVKEFTNKCNNYNGFNVVRVMVTDTDYSEKAKEYARQNNVILVNGKELAVIEHEKKMNLEDIVNLAKTSIKSRIIKSSFNIIREMIKTGGG